MPTRYTISNNFLENLLSLVIKDKPKSVYLNNADLSRLKFTLIGSFHPQITLDSTKTKLKVKTGNKIRNPKDFELFVEIYIESNLLANNSLPLNTVLFEGTYTQAEYVEEAIRNYAEGELQSQAFLTITTQGTYEEVTIESQSGPSFVSLKSQSNESIQTQSYQPIEMPTYTYEARVPISDSSGKSLTSSFYNRTNLMPILAKGAAITSYTRTYTA
jgi:hypothetical protein